MSLLQEAEALSQRRKIERKEAVNALAYRQAYGQAVAPEDIVTATEAAGVSLDDYAAEVDRLEKRKALLAKTAEQAELEKRQKECQRVIDAANAEVETARQRAIAKLTPAQQEQQLVNARLAKPSRHGRNCAGVARPRKLSTGCARSAASLSRPRRTARS